MKTVLIVLGLVACAVSLAADDFSLAGAKKDKAAAAAGGDDKQPGQWTSTKSVTVNKVKFSNPTWLKMKLGNDKVGALKIKIGSVVYYYPLAGTHSGMWLTMKDVKGKGRLKLVVQAQKFRVWYRKSCKADTFTGTVTCGFCFKIFALSGVLDYGDTESVTIDSIKYDLGAYKQSINLLGDEKRDDAQMEGVMTTVTFQGDEYPLFIALHGKYENKVVLANKRTGKIDYIKDANLDIYKRKYCSRGLHGQYRCRYCFIMTSAESGVFLPGPNILAGEDDDGNALYLNSPQYKIQSVTIENKPADRKVIRFISTSKGSKVMGFFWYLIDGEEAGQVWYNAGTRGWKKTGMKMFVYTRRVCRREGDNDSCYLKFKTYKSSGGPKLVTTTKSTKSLNVKVGVATLGRPVVAIVKTPGLRGTSKVRAAVFTGSTVDGESFNLNYAMDGPYAGKWFWVNSHKGLTVNFDSGGKALYNYKVCKASGWSGDVKCTWCFMIVKKVEAATGIPVGKTVTVDKASFSLPVDVKISDGAYTRMEYAKGTVSKTLFLKREGETASAGQWFTEDNKGRLVPFDVSYDVYFTHICTTFGKKKECRHCYKVQARPALAIKPLQPATSLTIASSKIVLSIYHTRLYPVMFGSKSYGLAHMFKACKSGTCTYLYYVQSGPYAGNWFTNMAKKKLYVKTSIVSNDLWKHYECLDGLSGVVCRYCFQF